MGVRIARKHVGWYLKEHAVPDSVKRLFNSLTEASGQIAAMEHMFDHIEINLSGECQEDAGKEALKRPDMNESETNTITTNTNEEDKAA